MGDEEKTATSDGCRVSPLRARVGVRPLAFIYNSTRPNVVTFCNRALASANALLVKRTSERKDGNRREYTWHRMAVCWRVQRRNDRSKADTIIMIIVTIIVCWHNRAKVRSLSILALVAWSRADLFIIVNTKKSVFFRLESDSTAQIFCWPIERRILSIPVAGTPEDLLCILSSKIRWTNSIQLSRASNPSAVAMFVEQILLICSMASVWRMTDKKQVTPLVTVFVRMSRFVLRLAWPSAAVK